MAQRSSSSSSIEKVAGDDDLLTEILIRVPVKSLLRFKSVSKRWLSLIINPHFVRCRNPDPSLVSGLFLYSSMRRSNPVLNFIPLVNDRNPADHDQYLKALTTFPGPSGKRILSSCRGLLCCSSYCQTEIKGNYFQYYVLNPTTKQLTLLPEPHANFQNLSLAYDPSKSPHYKVICVWSTKPFQKGCDLQIEIYSSETGSWRASGEPFTTEVYAQFLGRVYWNGAINWFNTYGNSYYFNVEDERFGVMPMPPIPEAESNRKGERLFRYYGESRDHLHLIEIYVASIQFRVYEMERDYSGWFVKYNVDLDAVGAAFPEMMQTILWDPMYYSFAILSLVRGEEDEGSFLVLHIPGKVIRYNLVEQTFEKICDIAPEHCDGNGMIEGSFKYFFSQVFQYFETISCI